MTPLAPLLRKYLPDSFVGPPDPLALLKVDAMTRLIDVEDTPYLWKIGGYYVWWDSTEGWAIDGSQTFDPTFVRKLLCDLEGLFQRMV